MASKAERESRDLKIVTAKSRSISDADVATSLDVSIATVQSVMKKWRDSEPDLETIDPIRMIEAMLFELRGSIEEYALVAATTKQDSVRVGAINKRVETILQTAALMQTTGVLPHDLGTLKIDLEVRAFASIVLEGFREFGVADEIVDKVVKRVEEAAGRPLGQLGPGPPPSSD